MTKRTKQNRLIDLIDCYKKIKGLAAVSTDEVAQWATANGLYPVPTMRDNPQFCDSWESKLASIKAKQAAEE